MGVVEGCCIRCALTGAPTQQQSPCGPAGAGDGDTAGGLPVGEAMRRARLRGRTRPEPFAAVDTPHTKEKEKRNHGGCNQGGGDRDGEGGRKGIQSSCTMMAAGGGGRCDTAGDRGVPPTSTTLCGTARDDKPPPHRRCRGASRVGGAGRPRQRGRRRACPPLPPLPTGRLDGCRVAPHCLQRLGAAAPRVAQQVSFKI